MNSRPQASLGRSVQPARLAPVRVLVPERAPAPPAPAPAPLAEPDALPGALTFQPDDGLCPAQRAFLARKAQYAFGGPFMPPDSVCAVCGGAGKHVCHRCGGTCVNPENAAEMMGLNLDQDLHSFNGKVDIRMYLMPGGPCFACRGTGTCGCSHCEGSGVAGGVMDKFSGD